MTTPPSDADIADAYVYLLARRLVIRQEHADRAAEGFAYNTVTYNPLGSADFVNPNLDVAYLEAWVAADDEHAVLLEVPAVEGRYSTAQLLDEWGEVIVNINERATPDRPSGVFALVAPGSDPPIPEGATRIALHSAKAKLLGRVELKGDPDGAVALQRRFTLTASDAIRVEPPPAIAPFDNATLAGVEIFEDLAKVLPSALDVSPAAAALQAKAQAVAAYAASSPDARERTAALLRDTVVPEFLHWALTGSVPYVNHWLVVAAVGNYGADYRLRTVANYVGIWANAGSEVVYFVSTRGGDGAPLDGSVSYRIRFAPDELPDAMVDGYWSVILVDLPDYRVVPNPLNRFNFNSHSVLERDPDGGLTIAIGPEPVAGVPEANWLPSPTGRPFSLTFRLYVPRAAARAGEWAPPPITRR